MNKCYHGNDAVTCPMTHGADGLCLHGQDARYCPEPHDTTAPPPCPNCASLERREREQIADCLRLSERVQELEREVERLRDEQKRFALGREIASRGTDLLEGRMNEWKKTAEFIAKQRDEYRAERDRLREALEEIAHQPDTHPLAAWAHERARRALAAQAPGDTSQSRSEHAGTLPSSAPTPAQIEALKEERDILEGRLSNAELSGEGLEKENNLLREYIKELEDKGCLPKAQVDALEAVARAAEAMLMEEDEALPYQMLTPKEQRLYDALAALRATGWSG